MSLGVALTVALVGLEGHVVKVEADVATGLPAFRVVGLPDTSIREARDRVKAAAANVGFPLPQQKITVNLSPAGVPKMGPGFDLSMAVALLAACGVIPPAAAADVVHIGELGLDGRLRRTRGVLPAILAALQRDLTRIVVPAANREEARLVPGVDVVAPATLGELLAWYRGEIAPAELLSPDPEDLEPPHEEEASTADLSDVIGQFEARLALEVAAAGGHHLLFLGPPGTGKSMMASLLPDLLPDLEDEESLEVTALHSVAGTLDPRQGLVRRPPLERPHHGASAVSLAGGGGEVVRPGAASRAHYGILALDEAAEFSSAAMQSLRQPLEQGWLEIHRARAVARFPARFQLVLTSNPCPCGLALSKTPECQCSPHMRRRYLGRISNPILDRLDLQVPVHQVTAADLAASRPDSTAVVAERVRVARARQSERLRGTPWKRNSQVPGPLLRDTFGVPREVRTALNGMVERAELTMRGHDRVLRVAWTLADLAGHDLPTENDVHRAIALRDRTGVTK